MVNIKSQKAVSRVHLYIFNQCKKQHEKEIKEIIREAKPLICDTCYSRFKTISDASYHVSKHKHYNFTLEGTNLRMSVG
jgi:hypothetical protein